MNLENISSTGSLVIANITASSNISASGNIITNQITASANAVVLNLSASSTITASGFYTSWSDNRVLYGFTKYKCI